VFLLLKRLNVVTKRKIHANSESTAATANTTKWVISTLHSNSMSTVVFLQLGQSLLSGPIDTELCILRTVILKGGKSELCAIVYSNWQEDNLVLSRHNHYHVRLLETKHTKVNQDIPRTKAAISSMLQAIVSVGAAPLQPFLMVRYAAQVNCNMTQHSLKKTIQFDDQARSIHPESPLENTVCPIPLIVYALTTNL